MIDSRESASVLVLVRLGTIRPDELAEAGYRPMARAAHPGLASLGATLATGCWPERHGVVRRVEPHPDRLSYTFSRPENRGVEAVWSGVVRSVGRAAVVGWPHGTIETAPGEGERLAWTQMVATEPRAADAAAARVLSPDLVRPPSRLAGILGRREECHRDLTLEILEEHAAEGPDLLMGMVVDGAPEETTGRVRAIQSRLAAARGGAPTVIEVRHPIPPDSITRDLRFGPMPWMRVDGPASSGFPLRPRVDAIAPLVRSLLGLDSTGPQGPAAPGSGFHGGAMDEAGLPRPRRISVFQLKASEQELHREIGLSLLARGDRSSAAQWIRSACEDQHGRLDPRLAILLVSLVDSGQRHRLLEEFRPRLGMIATAGESWFDGESIVDVASLGGLGPFVAGHLALGLRRSGRLRIDGAGVSAAGLPTFD